MFVLSVRASPCSPLELLLEQFGGGGDADGRTTGAKALFCLTAAEKAKTPWEELQLETAMVGLEGTTEHDTETGLTRDHRPGSDDTVTTAAMMSLAVVTLILTAVRRVGGGAVEETRGRCHSQVGHAVAVAVHAVADGVAIVTLLGGGAGDVTSRRNAARVTTVTNCRTTRAKVRPGVNRWTWWTGSGAIPCVASDTLTASCPLKEFTPIMPWDAVLPRDGIWLWFRGTL